MVMFSEHVPRLRTPDGQVVQPTEIGTTHDVNRHTGLISWSVQPGETYTARYLSVSVEDGVVTPAYDPYTPIEREVKNQYGVALYRGGVFVSLTMEAGHTYPGMVRDIDRLMRGEA